MDENRLVEAISTAVVRKDATDVSVHRQLQGEGEDHSRKNAARILHARQGDVVKTSRLRRSEEPHGHLVHLPFKRERRDCECDDDLVHGCVPFVFVVGVISVHL